MIVSHSLKAIFVSNPKTGSRSIEAALARFHDEPQLDNETKDGYYTSHHMPACELKERLGDAVWQRYYKFAFVRNPWDWFISQHFYNLRKQHVPHRVDLQLSGDDILGTYEFLRSYRGTAWAYSACQWVFICNQSGTVLLDHIGRFEFLNRDFSTVLDALGCTVDLPHLNPSAHHDYREYYTEATRQLVGRLLLPDTRRFNYDF